MRRYPPDTLAIIGNGFDLAHGYKTDYRSFAESTESPYLEEFRSYCQREQIATWYLFEENIRRISGRLFLDSMEEGCDFAGNRREVARVTAVFQEIQRLLARCLAREMARIPFCKKRSIQEQLGPGGVAINFNYTQTAEQYLPAVFYVHGSLKEEDILLGYDYREEPCLAQFADMRWSKQIGRESLAFRRFLRQQEGLCPGSPQYNRMIAGLEGYHHWENSGRGLEEEMKAILPGYGTIHRFLTAYRLAPFPGLEFSSIRTVVALGHGIEGDKAYLRSLMDRCGGIDRIVLFRYDGEPEESYQRKRRFFAPYCDRVDPAFY